MAWFNWLNQVKSIYIGLGKYNNPVANNSLVMTSSISKITPKELFNSSFSSYSIKNNLNYNSDRNPALLGLEVAGGTKSECLENIEKIGQIPYEYPKPLWSRERMGELGHVKTINVEKLNNDVIQVDESKLIYNQRIHPNNYETFEELMNGFFHWWTDSKNKGQATGEEHIKSLRRMADYPVYPVNWFDLPNQIEQIINQLIYRDRYGYEEKKKETDNPLYGRHQMNNFLKAIDAFGRANNIHGLRKTITPYLNLKKTPKPKQPNLPPPPVVNKLIHHNYTKDKEVNAEIKTILILGFSVGPRPSELMNMKMSYVNHRTCEVKKREDKVNNVDNWVDVEWSVINSHQQPSLKRNWIDLHRKRLMDRLGISEDEDEGWLFPNPQTGKRFTSSPYLYKWLCGYVKPVLTELYPEEEYDFHPKIMRTWCGTGTLILTKVRDKKWDLREVKYRLGHDNESDVSEDYVRLAKKLIKKYPFDWFKAVLKFHPNSKRMKELMKEENGESQEKDDRKSINGQNTLTEMKSTGGIRSAPVGI